RLAECRWKVDEALGAVVSRSPQIWALRAQVEEAWRRLRTLRTAFTAISQLDGKLRADALAAEEPIDAGFWLSKDVPFPHDEEFVRAWVAAVTALRGDAAAPLPEAGG